MLRSVRLLAALAVGLSLPSGAIAADSQEVLEACVQRCSDRWTVCLSECPPTDNACMRACDTAREACAKPCVRAAEKELEDTVPAGKDDPK